MPPEPAAAPPGPILIVEDNATNLFILRSMLRKLGHQPLEAVDGRGGVAMTLEHRPGLVLMDLRMPEMDGMAAAAAIRAALGPEAPPLIAVTATITPEQRAACANAGFAGLIAKPVAFAELAETVSRHLGTP